MFLSPNVGQLFVTSRTFWVIKTQVLLRGAIIKITPMITTAKAISNPITGIIVNPNNIKTKPMNNRIVPTT